MDAISHICGIQGECNDYCGGGQMRNLRSEVAAIRKSLEAASKDIEVYRKALGIPHEPNDGVLSNGGLVFCFKCVEAERRADRIKARLAAAERALSGEEEDGALFVMRFCEGAINDAILSEDGLDGAAGEGVLKMIAAFRLRAKAALDGGAK